MPLPYTWEAIYTDHERIEQYAHNGIERSTVNIDRTKLSQFMLHGPFGPLVVLNLDQGDRFFYRRRSVVGGINVVACHLMIVQKFSLPQYDYLKASMTQQGFCILQPKDIWIVPTVELFGVYRTHHEWLYPIDSITIAEQQRIRTPLDPRLKVVSHYNGDTLGRITEKANVGPTLGDFSKSRSTIGNCD